MLSCIQGSPGSGKSAVAVALALDHVRNGGVVAANFGLVHGWSDVLANRSMWSWFDEEYRYKRSLSYYNRLYHVKSLQAVMEVGKSLPNLCEGVHTYDGSYKEGGGLLILDEAQLIFNSRKWDKNFSWIEFFTQHRKLGWNVLVIAHSIEMIDSQIRPLFEYEARFRNLQKVRIPVLGVPLCPYPVFNVVYRYAGLGSGAGIISHRDLVPLPLWAARLYDSLAVFNSTAETEATPLLCGNPPQKTFQYKPQRKSVGMIAAECLWTKYEEYEKTDNRIL